MAVWRSRCIPSESLSATGKAGKIGCGLVVKGFDAATLQFWLRASARRCRPGRLVAPEVAKLLGFGPRRRDRAHRSATGDLAGHHAKQGARIDCIIFALIWAAVDPK